MIENLREQKEQKEREERARLEELEQMRKENQELKDKMATVLTQKQLGNTGQTKNQNENQQPSREVSGTCPLPGPVCSSWRFSEQRPLVVAIGFSEQHTNKKLMLYQIDSLFFFSSQK